jgi:DNA processing protein
VMTTQDNLVRAPSAGGPHPDVASLPPDSAELAAIRLARAYLVRVAEPPSHALSALVAAIGPVRAAELVRAGTVPDAVAGEVTARRDLDLAAEDLRAVAALGGRLVIPEDPDWPAWSFLALDRAAARAAGRGGSPLGLWVRGTGSLAELTERAVTVVGARAATRYGEHIAADLGHALVGRGFTVVSGAAYGIDGAAHRGALAGGGPTVAVLACGLDFHYPAGHVDLLSRIARHGLVISEYPPGTPPARHRFLVRNRIIAALGIGTVIVEAGLRSGARNTAATARALGRVVAAMPGPVESAMSVGCHQLLRSGDAVLVSDVDEVIETVGTIGGDLAPPRSSAPRPADRLSGEAFRVHEALLDRAGRSVERIAADSGVPVQRVRALLPELEIGGLVRRSDSGWRRVSERR